MIAIHPHMNLQTFVAASLGATGFGFMVIVGVGFGFGLTQSNSVSPSSNVASTTVSRGNTNPTTNTEWKATTPESITTTTASTASTPSVSTTSPKTSTTPTPTPKPTPTPTPPPPTPPPTPPPAPTYCGGQTTCYGRADLAAHTTAASCWGYINNIMYNVTSLISSHSGGSSPIRAVCGGNIGAALGSAPGNSKHTSALRNSAGSTLWAYKIAYYDATKP